jgi:hypothetical protein
MKLAHVKKHSLGNVSLVYIYGSTAFWLASRREQSVSTTLNDAANPVPQALTKGPVHVAIRFHGDSMEFSG